MKVSLRKKGAALLIGLSILTALTAVPAQAADNDAARRLTAERDVGNGRTEVRLYQADENFQESETEGFLGSVDHYVAYTYPGEPVRLVAAANADGASLSWQTAVTAAGSGMTDASWTEGQANVSGQKSTLEVTPDNSGETYVKLSDTASHSYYIKLETASPNVNIAFAAAAAAGDGYASAGVTVSGSRFNSLAFTMQINGGENSTGLSDNAGGEILAYADTKNSERINVLTGKGYTAADVEVPGVGAVLTTEDGADGWKNVSKDGAVWFSYNGNLLNLADITYRPAEKALTVTLMAAMSGGNDSTALTAVDATETPVEVFRFWYGLKEGKNGTGLGEILEKVEAGDEFMPIDIATGGNDNVVQDERFGPVSRKGLNSLVTLTMDVPLKGLAVTWKGAALLLHQTDATMADQPKNGFDLETSYYNLYVIRDAEIVINAEPGKSGGSVAWKKAVVEPGAAVPEDGWTAENGAVSQNGKSVLTLTPTAGKDTYLNINGYQVRVRAMSPNVDVRFDSNTQDAKVSTGSVVLSGTKTHAVTFTVQGLGGSDANGFTDAEGSLVYEGYTGYTRVDLLTGKGYDADDQENADAFSPLTKGDKDAEGWITYSKGGKAMFAYQADQVEPAAIVYYPTQKAISVTLTATTANAALGLTTVDTMTDPAELFRFYYGLKSGKTGWNLKNVFFADDAMDDFRVLDINSDGADNAMHDAYLGDVNYQKLSTLVTRTLIPHATGKIEVELYESNTGFRNVRWTLEKITGDGTVETVLQEQQLTAASDLCLLLDAGSYRLTLNAPGYLPDVVLLNNVDPEKGDLLESIDAIRLYPGNSDTVGSKYVINLADRQALLAVLGRTTDGPMADTVKTSDFNQDKVVDIYDVGALLANMGRKSNGDNTAAGKTNYTAYDQVLTTLVSGS